MKRLLLLVGLALCASAAWSQDTIKIDTSAIARPEAAVDQADDEEENVIGARPRPKNRKRQEANVLGAPVYYDVNGPRPKHHYRNKEDDFCSFFLEGEGLLGPKDMAVGFNFTYLPERWGAYASVLSGYRHDYLTLGPALRLSSDGSNFDAHLYGGLVLSERHAGGEVGFRIASNKRYSEFNFLSASLGLAFVDGDTYVTCGLSVDALALTSLFTLFFW